MNKIIRYAKTFICVGCLFSITSCGDDEVEVVSQDTSWTIDNQYIEEDIREELGLNPFIDLIYFSYYNSPIKEMKANYDLEHVTIVGSNELSFKVRITKPFKEDLTLRLVADRKASFPMAVEDYEEVQDKNFMLGTTVLKAGEIETNVSFSFKDIDDLNQLPGYVLALTLNIENKPEQVAVSKKRATFYLKLNTFIQLENIASGNEPIDGELFNDIVTFASDIRPDKVNTLNDGDRKKNSWYTSAATNYLTMTFSETVTLKGIRVDTNPGATSNYALKSVKVMVDRGDGKWLSHGVYDGGHINGEANIKFKSPVQCVGIRFEEMQSTTGKVTVDINEITFIK